MIERVRWWRRRKRGKRGKLPFAYFSLPEKFSFVRKLSFNNAAKFGAENLLILGEFDTTEIYSTTSIGHLQPSTSCRQPF